jgi:hypothetical protein
MWNMLGCNPPLDKLSNMELNEIIRQVDIDSFWSTESLTVGSNLREARRMEKTMRKYGLPPATALALGRWPLFDSVGMKAARAVLDRSLDKGVVYEDTIQWDTFQKQVSTVTNILQAAVSGLENSGGAYKQKRMWISNLVSHQFYGFHAL